MTATFYGTTYQGGAYNLGTIFSMVLTGAPAAPVITSATTAAGQAGTAFSYQITATNSPTSFGATGLPQELSVNASSGLISGKPMAAGTFSIGLSAMNAGGSGTATLTLTVAAGPPPAPVITSVTTAGAVVIPAGKPSYTLKVNPLQDPGATGTATVKIQLLPDPKSNYELGSKVKAVIELIE